MSAVIPMAEKGKQRFNALGVEITDLTDHPLDRIAAASRQIHAISVMVNAVMETGEEGGEIVSPAVLREVLAAVRDLAEHNVVLVQELTDCSEWTVQRARSTTQPNELQKTRPPLPTRED
jgi:hypothetical protein